MASQSNASTATITPETVKHVARLSRLELSDAEIERFTHDLTSIMGLIESLSDLDLSQPVNTMHTEQPALYRPDEPLHQYDREELMANAPAQEGTFFRVPKILES